METNMRHGGKVRAGVLLALVGLSGSCVDVGGSLAIVQAQQVDMSDGKCVIPAMKTEARLGSGVLDTALDRSYPYVLYPLVENRLPPIADMGGIEPNRIDVTATEVTIEAPPGINVPWSASCPPRFDYASDRVSLGPGESAPIQVEAIRACHVDVIRNMFVSGQLPAGLNDEVRFRAIVRAKGRHGGTSMDSDRFEFPIRICFGCLQTGYAMQGFTDFTFPKVPSCGQLVSNPYQGNACNRGQDIGPILCCARDAEGKNLECPGIPRAMPATSAP